MAKSQQVIVQRSTPDKIKDLLDLVNIKAVYYVDDENNLFDLDVQLVLGEIAKIFGQAKEAHLAEIQLEAWDRDLPEEGVTESLQQLWPDLPFESKLDIYKKILAISVGEDLQFDPKRALLVGEQIPSGLVKVLSPAEWDNEKKNIEANASGDHRILILFDEELALAGGRFVITKGQDLIVEVQKWGLSDAIICTLLTGKTTTQKELSYRNSVIADRNHEQKDPLSINDFFPLAKERLDTAEVFADGIKKVLINRYFEEIKEHTVRVIKHSYEQAIGKIEAFDTYDFDDTILRTSVKDGIWEPETIIRISDIVFETALKRRMVETDYPLKVNDKLKFVQDFSSITFDIPESIQPYSEKLILRHQEIYDPGEIINALRKPLENGDLFSIAGEQYILVAQACDMAVRKKNETVGLRTAKVATLLKINTITRDEFKKKMAKGHYLRDLFPLEYFTSSKSDVGMVDFKEFLIVDIDFLDLCVFNPEGRCHINLSKLENKDYLSKIWESRYDILVSRLTEIQSSIFAIEKSLRVNESISKRSLWKLVPEKYRRRFLKVFVNPNFTAILEAFYPKFILASSVPSVHKVKLENDGSFDFGASRIGKYKDFGATYLLERYTRHLSRIAEPHDFAVGK